MLTPADFQGGQWGYEFQNEWSRCRRHTACRFTVVFRVIKNQFSKLQKFRQHTLITQCISQHSFENTPGAGLKLTHYSTCLLLSKEKNKTNTSRLLIAPNLWLEPLCTSQKYRHSFDFLARAALKLAHYSTWEGEKRLFLHDKLH